MPREPFDLSAVQRDRAVGALLGVAVGDALAAGGETAPLGQWGANTALTIALAEIATFSTDLCAIQRLDDLLTRWKWLARNVELGPQTAAALAAVGEGSSPTRVMAARNAAIRHHDTGGASDGSCLTRAVPAALAWLIPRKNGQAAATGRTLGNLTHAGAVAGEACALWTGAVRHAVLTGELNLRTAWRRPPAAPWQHLWEARLAEAERLKPAELACLADDPVGTVQAAWAAIVATPVPQHDPSSGRFAADHLRDVLEGARAVGANADTLAAAGGLLGAAYGASAIPWDWRLALRGSPGLNAHLLIDLAEKILNGGDPREVDAPGSWTDSPAPQRHPCDEQVWLGVSARLGKVPDGVDTVVSLCPVDGEDVPAGVTHLDVRLINEADANANLDFVLLDTVRAIEALRGQGATVFLHGRHTRSRVPAVAALYGARCAGVDIETALQQVRTVLPDADPNDDFTAALRRLHTTIEGDK